MVSGNPLQSIDEQLSPLQELVIASARDQRIWLRLLLLLDARCSRICRNAREMMMGQIRLAWLRDALGVSVDNVTESGDPLVDTLRAHPAYSASQASLAQIINGWEELLIGLNTAEVSSGQDSMATLRAFAESRGGGFFGAVLAAMDKDNSPPIEQAGAIWAVWDIAGQLTHDPLVPAAVLLGAELASGASLPSLPRPLAILARLSHADLLRRRGAPPAMTFALYLRVLRLQILGR